MTPTGFRLICLLAAGLFYSYNVDDDDYPGRVRFIPFAQLLGDGVRPGVVLASSA